MNFMRRIEKMETSKVQSTWSRFQHLSIKKRVLISVCTIASAIVIFPLITIILRVIATVFAVSFGLAFVLFSLFIVLPLLMRWSSRSGFIKPRYARWSTNKGFYAPITTLGTRIYDQVPVSWQILSIKTYKADVHVYFFDQPHITIDVIADNTLHSVIGFSCQYDEETGVLLVDQGNAQSKIKLEAYYTLQITLPLGYSFQQLSMRMVEGSLIVHQSTKLLVHTLILEALNTKVEILDTQFDSVKINGLNMTLDTHNMITKRLRLNASGSELSMHFDEPALHIKLRSSLVLSHISFNDEILPAYKELTNIYTAPGNENIMVLLSFNLLRSNVKVSLHNNKISPALLTS
jgi:hypothetical protein